MTGLRARGAVGVDIEWKNGKAKKVTLRPDRTILVVVRAPRGQHVAGYPGPTAMLSLRRGVSRELRFDR